MPKRQSKPAAPPARPVSAPGRWPVVAFAVLGLAASVPAAVIHHRLLTTPDYESFCDINATWSCASAYLSPYGSLFGIPVAVLGVLFFALVLLLLYADRRGSRSAMGAVAVLSTVGLAVCAYLAYATFVVLGSVCILCLVTYVAVLGLFIWTAVMGRTPLASLPQALGHDVGRLARSPLAIGVAMLFVVGATTTIAYFPRSAPAAPSVAGTPAPEAPAAAQTAAAERPLGDRERRQIERAFDALPRVGPSMQLPPDAEGAAVVVVKFNDFQCPACARAYQMYKPLFERWERDAPGQVREVIKDFPLEPECNTRVNRIVHPAACEAAVGVRLAREQGRAVELEEWFYANQGAMTPESVRRAVREVGGVEDFDARYAAELDAVRRDVALGGDLEVTATPTFIVNGVKLERPPEPTVLDVIIAYEIRKAAESD